MAHSGANHDLPLLSGPTPGLLDPSQPSRLLRTPTCNLFFAAFDPLTARASNFPNLSALHIDPGSSSKRANLEAAASTNGKRVVIEIDAESGTCLWRFVPRAKTESEVLGDEGSWPRVVELCGRPVRMTQDQWDIHKLDPEYECLVRASPSASIITRIDKDDVEFDTTSVPEPPATPKTAPGSLDDMTPTPKAKRHISPTSPESDSPRKRKKIQATFSMASDKMAVDEDVFYVPSTPAPKTAAEDVANGKKRRRVSDRLGETSTSGPRKMKGMPHGKHTGSSVFADLSSNPWSGATDRHNAEVPPIPAKKVRTRSPGTVRRSMEQKRADREKKRKADMDVRIKKRRDGMNRAFWKDIGFAPVDDADVAPARSESDDPEAAPSDDGFTDPSNSATEDEDEAPAEADRLAKIEESRRKLAELEKDKPLWEESARKRQDREAEAEQMRQRARALREEEARLQERVRAARKQREEIWEQEQREREYEARVREQSGRMVVSQPRSTYRWSSRFALERYIRTAVDFDTAKFSSAGRPMAFASVPWPMLHASFSVQDVDWDAVETFFKEVQRLLMPSEFKDLVEKSHRRFHPDRWRSRGLLVSVGNEYERDLLEIAGSTVAQAITPLWKEVTGR